MYQLNSTKASYKLAHNKYNYTIHTQKQHRKQQKLKYLLKISFKDLVFLLNISMSLQTKLK